MTDGSTADAATPLLRAEDFEPFVGGDVRFGDTGATLVLKQVERSEDRFAVGLPRAPFTLLFAGPKGDTYLREGVYACDFGGGTVHDIHVAPIHTPAPARQDYQAVFN